MRERCRRCNCYLGRDNRGGTYCSPCRRSLMDVETTARAERVVDIYAAPDRFTDARGFLAELSAALDELAQQYGVEPPDFSETFA